MGGGGKGRHKKTPLGIWGPGPRGGHCTRGGGGGAGGGAQETLGGKNNGRCLFVLVFKKGAFRVSSGGRGGLGAWGGGGKKRGGGKGVGVGAGFRGPQGVS